MTQCSEMRRNAMQCTHGFMHARTHACTYACNEMYAMYGMHALCETHAMYAVGPPRAYPIHGRISMYVSMYMCIYMYGDLMFKSTLMLMFTIVIMFRAIPMFIVYVNVHRGVVMCRNVANKIWNGGMECNVECVMDCSAMQCHVM